MLPDYEITKTNQPKHKFITFLEFVLILIIFQSAIMLLTGGENEEAIQFRILAHSNTEKDQLEKREIQQEIAPLIQHAVATSNSNDELVDKFKQLEPEIIDIANKIVQNKSISLERKDAIIPPKRSGFYIQPQATYDAYILTIGSGRGDNFWCSLFPNVCFPENEEKQEKEEEKVTFFVWEWIKGLFS
ncbi:stage II sporulation protein R [Sporosarcina ureilytica]|uniref:Stage II sporulation protein R n=1 Tax=Sporosarcina ureilytica TaxID=298596 RepID=A0A1D8JJG8_9BACL|nr:stage II sporulation protein R [Sporosarcina ureilytica]AOV08842.1 hypothetical protein BI350_15660 [Sporosarcina ureilytica]